jgi:crotonobetainyl-CoA:carnitine CoA-transferase CaiB-like acyl-CoA transferase
MSAPTPLAGIRVLEWSSTLAGGYAGRLLRDLGAEVTRVGGAATVGKDPELDVYLHEGKDAREVSFEDLPSFAAAERADIVVLDLPDAPTGDLVQSFGDAVVVAITPWGLDGPWAGSGRPWSEFTLQVESGSLTLRGSMESYPIATGSSESLWIAGTMAAGAAVAATQGGPQDRVIDVSLLEVTVYATNLFQDVAAAVVRTPSDSPAYRIRLSPSVEPAKDGWIGFNLASAQNHQDFLVLIERPDWLADEQMSTFIGRYMRYDEWTEAVRSWTTRHTVAEIVEVAAQYRIPCAPVHNGETILEDPQVRDRQFYGELPGAPGVLAPKPPMLFDGARAERSPSVTTGARPTASGASGAPFEGVRVLDLGTWWVGAYVGSTLGAFGADVIKIESTRRIDGARTLGGVPQTQDHWWECGNFYLGGNFNKRNVTLDLTQPEGRDILVRMIGQADVLIENYAPRVLESVGLDWDSVQAINPRLTMLRMPAFGLTGPRRSMVGYAQTVEQFSGLCWRTGYAGGDPTNPQGPADPMGGANSFFALAAALREARATGRGILVEAPLVEGALVMSAEQVLRWTSRHELMERRANRAEDADLQGMFPVQGADRWVGISITDDEQWAALARVIGAGHWLDDRDLATREGRHARADELEKQVAAWTAEQEGETAVQALLAAGVPAAVTADCRFIHQHPHLAARGSFEMVDLPYAGEVPLPTLPFRRVDHPSWLTRRPPLLGEHNDEVFRDELGLDDAVLADLAARQVIGTEPAGS